MTLKTFSLVKKVIGHHWKFDVINKWVHIFKMHYSRNYMSYPIFSFKRTHWNDVNWNSNHQWSHFTLIIIFAVNWKHGWENKSTITNKSTGGYMSVTEANNKLKRHCLAFNHWLQGLINISWTDFSHQTGKTCWKWLWTF